MKKLMAALGIALCGAATAAPADWTQYLCRYTTSDVSHRTKSDAQTLTQLIKVNEKDIRVVYNGAFDPGLRFDANAATGAVKINGTQIMFQVLRWNLPKPQAYGVVTIAKATGELRFYGHTSPEVGILGKGTCKVVTD